jgi:hypothetical protein
LFNLLCPPSLATVGSLPRAGGLAGPNKIQFPCEVPVRRNGHRHNQNQEDEEHSVVAAADGAARCFHTLLDLADLLHHVLELLGHVHVRHQLLQVLDIFFQRRESTGVRGLVYFWLQRGCS